MLSKVDIYKTIIETIDPVTGAPIKRVLEVEGKSQV